MAQNIQRHIENHGFLVPKTTIKMRRKEISTDKIGPLIKENGQTARQKTPTRNQKSNLEEIWPSKTVNEQKFKF